MGFRDSGIPGIPRESRESHGNLGNPMGIPGISGILGILGIRNPPFPPWLRMSKRFVENTSVLEKCVSWCTNNAITDSVPNFEEEEILLLSNFPETF